jgi:hypothetical protein
MQRGIYIMANDRVMGDAIACLNSIRLHDPHTPICLIPYDDQYQTAATRLRQDYGVELFPDLDFVERLAQNLHQIFGPRFFARPNQFRKQACWFGPFQQFLYIDADTVVFSPIIRFLASLDQFDFLCYDYQHNGGIENVFTEKVITAGIFTQNELQDIFNAGFWASKRGLIQEADLYETFRECAAHADYFDFSQKTSDQPIFNYLILKRISRRFNLVRQPGMGPGSWAGSRHFQTDGVKLIDPTVGKPLDYLHWAGFRIAPGCPYWDLWAYYRYLRHPEERPPATSLSQGRASRLLPRLQQILKQLHLG